MLNKPLVGMTIGSLSAAVPEPAAPMPKKPRKTANNLGKFLHPKRKK